MTKTQTIQTAVENAMQAAGFATRGAVRGLLVARADVASQTAYTAREDADTADQAVLWDDAAQKWIKVANHSWANPDCRARAIAAMNVCLTAADALRGF